MARVIQFCRKPLVAYLAITLTLMAGAGLYQENVNDRLRDNDYHACIRAEVLTENANVKLIRLGETPLPVPDCQALQP